MKEPALEFPRLTWTGLDVWWPVSWGAWINTQDSAPTFDARPRTPRSCSGFISKPVAAAMLLVAADFKEKTERRNPASPEAARSAMLARTSQRQTSKQCRDAGANAHQTESPIEQDESNKRPRVLTVPNLPEKPRVDDAQRDSGKRGCQSCEQKTSSQDQADDAFCCAGVHTSSSVAERPGSEGVNKLGFAIGRCRKPSSLLGNRGPVIRAFMHLAFFSHLLRHGAPAASSTKSKPRRAVA